jgi:hypothetical protein
MEKYTIERHKCFECGSEKNIHGHHVVPKVLGGNKTIPLCGICHGKVHGKNFGMNWRRLQMEGIKKAQEKGIYKIRENHRRKETIPEFLYKHKNTIDLLIKYPDIKNSKLAEITGVHFNTVTKIRKITGIKKTKNKL